jgi:hypothetical protein
MKTFLVSILMVFAVLFYSCGDDNIVSNNNNNPPINNGDLIYSQDSMKLFWTSNNSYQWTSYTGSLSLSDFESITWKFDNITTNLTTNEAQFYFRFASYGGSNYDRIYYGNEFSTLNNFSKTMYSDSSGYTQFNSITPGLMIRFDDLNTPQPDKFILIKNLKLYKKSR